MDQKVSTQLNTKVSARCGTLEHELRDSTKDRSRRLRKVSQRFLNIYKNSEMSHIDRQVKKLSTMADTYEPKAEEMDPQVHLNRSSTSSDEVLVFPVDSCTTSYTFGSATGTIVHQASSPKENFLSSHHSKQCCRRHSGKIMSIFQGRRGRPPKPLWVRVPRRSLALCSEMEADSHSQARDMHPDNYKLRSRPPLKKRRVDMLDVGTPSHSYPSCCLGTSISSRSKNTCDGLTDSAKVSGVSGLPLCAKEDTKCLPTIGGVRETAIFGTSYPGSNRGAEVKSPCLQDGLNRIAIPAFTPSTAQGECKDVYLSSNAQNVTLQSVITDAGSVVQGQQQNVIPTDTLSVSIPKQTLGALWYSLNANPPTVAAGEEREKNLPDTIGDHQISAKSSFVANGAPKEASSSSLVVSLPVASTTSSSYCHKSIEYQSSISSSFSSLNSFLDSPAEVALPSECTASSHVASTVLPRPLDNPGLLHPCHDCKTVTSTMTTDAICDKTCTTLIDDQCLNFCTSLEAVSCEQPAVEATQEEMPDQASLVQFPSNSVAVNGDSNIVSNHCQNGIRALQDRSYHGLSHLAAKDSSITAQEEPDSGKFAPCLTEVSLLPKESSETSPLPAEQGKHRAGWMQCNPGEANMDQQKISQPWQPAADALPTDNGQEAVKQLVHEAIESSVAALPVDPCSSTNLGSTDCLQEDDSCTPGGSHHSLSKMASCVTAIEDPSDVDRDPGDVTHSGRGDSTILITNEALNSSSELKIEESEDLTEASMKTEPLFDVDQQEAKTMRPQREQARKRRNEKAFLYDENLVDLILAEHEPLLPVRKDSLKPVKEDKASAVAAKPYLRHRGLAKTSKQKNAIETNLLEAVQSKGSGSKLPPSLKRKGSWIAKGQKFASAANRKMESDKDGRKKAQKGSLLYKNAKARSNHSSQGRDTPAKGSSSAVKLAIPMVASSLRGRKCAMPSTLVAGENGSDGVKSKFFNEGKQPVNVAVEEYQKKSILEPPPPLSRNYWRTAQAWLPRKVPKTHQGVVALRQKAQDMKTGAVSKSHLEENNGWRWLGDPISVSKYMLKGKQIIRSYFIGMRRGRKHTEDLLARDCVLVFSGDVDKFPYVGRIVSLWQDSGSDEMMFTTAWYHRPADVLGSKTAETYSERELFASNHQDDNPVASILCKCFVMGYNEYCRFRGAYSCSQSMVKSSLADILVPNPSPHQPFNFHIPAANSKIDLSQVFYCKNSLVSARHHTNRMKTDQRMRLKYMQKGVKPH